MKTSIEAFPRLLEYLMGSLSDNFVKVEDFGKAPSEASGALPRELELLVKK